MRKLYKRFSSSFRMCENFLILKLHICSNCKKLDYSGKKNKQMEANCQNTPVHVIFDNQNKFVFFFFYFGWKNSSPSLTKCHTLSWSTEYTLKNKTILNCTFICPWGHTNHHTNCLHLVCVFHLEMWIPLSFNPGYLSK